jgi:hypothetical protein
LGKMLSEKLLAVGDIDPLGRHLCVGKTREALVQIALLAEDEEGASQMCKNKERNIIRDCSSRIKWGTQSCGSSDSCSDPELISSRQSSRV